MNYPGGKGLVYQKLINSDILHSGKKSILSKTNLSYMNATSNDISCCKKANCVMENKKIPYKALNE